MPGQLLATDYMSMNVYGPNNERIGDVSNVLIDDNGKVVAILVGVGGFLGIGEKTVALPFESIKVSGPGNPLIVNHTKADLEKAPSFVSLRTSGSGSTSGSGAPTKGTNSGAPTK
jgi:sporulation protein YlmC with PRC-barrel domain